MWEDNWDDDDVEDDFGVQLRYVRVGGCFVLEVLVLCVKELALGIRGVGVFFSLAFTLLLYPRHTSYGRSPTNSK